jgi:hypothetical protein
MKYLFVAGLFFLSATGSHAQQRDSLPTPQMLDSVLVVGERNIRRNNLYQFAVKEYKQMVSLIGETDALRYVATLPGVSQGMEGGMGFFVRGGNSSNNRIELDDVPLYGSTHLFGLFSIFPSDIIAGMDFCTGGIAASTGNCLASIIKITGKQPDNRKYHGSFSISPFVIGASVSGPITPNLTFHLAGRISPLRAEIALIQSLANIEGNLKPEMADAYARLDYRFSRRHQLSVSGYLSNDYFQYAADFADNIDVNEITMNWGNKLLRASWDWSPNDHWKIKALAYYTGFFSGNRQKNYAGNRQKGELRLQTNLHELTMRATITYEKNNFSINGGVQGQWQSIHPGAEKIILTGQNNQYAFNMGDMPRTWVGFGEVGYKHKRFSATAGLRGTIYQIEGQTIPDGNIRIAAEMEVSNHIGIGASYDELSQFHHIAEGLPVGWSLDLLLPSDRKFVPEKAHQFYTGGHWTYQSIACSAGVYYKYMNHLISYKNSSNIFGVQNTTWQEEITSGQGSSYGMETRLERKGTDWNVTLSYTLSKTDRQFNEINDGRQFPAKFDRRHILNFTGQLLTLKRTHWSHYCNLSVAFSSGNHLTIPIGLYKGITPPFWDQQDGGFYISPQQEENAQYRQLMSNVNGYTVPDYFRVDVSYNFTRTGNRITHDLTVGVFNLLNRQNPYLIFYKEGRWQQLSLFPIVPTINWNMSF